MRSEIASSVLGRVDGGGQAASRRSRRRLARAVLMALAVARSALRVLRRHGGRHGAEARSARGSSCAAPDVSLAGRQRRLRLGRRTARRDFQRVSSQIMTREATARDIVVADPTRRPAISCAAISPPTHDRRRRALEYVWDVFNKDKQRTQRVDDVLDVKGEGADPWRIVDEAALASVAAKSADDLAAYLSNTPEAVAAAPAQPLAISAAAELHAGQLAAAHRRACGQPGAGPSGLVQTYCSTPDAAAMTPRHALVAAWR